MKIFIGDIHGHFDFLTQFCLGNPEHEIIQVGDFGVGFKPLPEFPTNMSFIRGNHDNPELCQSHPNCLGDFGFSIKHNLFFVAGAHSIDRLQRQSYINYWPNEELTYGQQSKALLLYEEIKPEIMVSHDCPQEACEKLFGIKDTNSTRSFLNVLWGIHKPKKWIFGHHHKPREKKIKDTTFFCIEECGVLRM